MIKESAICAASISIGVLLLCLGLGVDFAQSWYYVILAAAVPFFAATWLQLKVMGAISHGKAITWLGGAPMRSGAPVVIEPRPPRRSQPLQQPVIIDALSEPDRVRLVPVIAQPNSMKMASETEIALGDIMRLVPVAQSPRLIDGVAECDLVEFVSRIKIRGHSRSSWYGVRMPSGRKVNSRYHSMLVACVKKVGGFAGHRKGSDGELALEPGEIAQRLGLTLEPAPPVPPA